MDTIEIPQFRWMGTGELPVTVPVKYGEGIN